MKTAFFQTSLKSITNNYIFLEKTQLHCLNINYKIMKLN